MFDCKKNVQNLCQIVVNSWKEVCEINHIPLSSTVYTAKECCAIRGILMNEAMMLRTHCPHLYVFYGFNFSIQFYPSLVLWTEQNLRAGVHQV